MVKNEFKVDSTINDWALILFLPAWFVLVLVSIGFWNEWEPLIPADYQILSMIPFGILYFGFTYFLIKTKHIGNQYTKQNHKTISINGSKIVRNQLNYSDCVPLSAGYLGRTVLSYKTHNVKNGLPCLPLLIVSGVLFHNLFITSDKSAVS